MRSIPAVVMLLAVGLTACTAEEAARPNAKPSETRLPLSGFDTGAVTVARTSFCGRVPRSAAELALGAPVSATSDYANGDRARIDAGLHDVAHEFGCSWSADDGATATAWVFGPAVTRKQARAMVRGLGRERGCSTPHAERFGRPSVATLCTTGSGAGRLRAAYHGLFVDAWLSCSVSGTTRDEKAILDRAGDWCVQVATAVDTSPG